MALAAHAADGNGPKENDSSSANNNILRGNAHESDSFCRDPYQLPSPVVVKRRDDVARAVTSSYNSRRRETAPSWRKPRGDAGGGSGGGHRNGRASTAAAPYSPKNAAAGAVAEFGSETGGRRMSRGNGSSMAATSATTAEAFGYQADGVSATAATTTAVTPTAEEERGAAKIRAQMSVLMVGFFEIIRQVKWA